MFALATSLLVMTSCTPQLPAPEVRSLSPSWGYNGEVTENVSIVGRRFYPRIQLSGSSESEVDRQFKAYLLSEPMLELENVELLSYTELEADVPEGLPPGLYGVMVESPAGETGLLDGAFTVTDTRAAKLELTEPDETTLVVNSYLEVEVQLVDPDGSDVDSSLEIEIVVEASADGDVNDVRFQETLTNQEPIDRGVGVRGELNRDGSAYLALTSASPGFFHVEVRAADENSVVESAGMNAMFTAGELSAIDVELPTEEGYWTVAGETFQVRITFVDASGFRVQGATGSAMVAEACSTVFAPQYVSFAETTTVTVTATGATDGITCDSNRIVAIGGVDGTDVSGQSNTFEVFSGAAEELDVRALPTQVAAGDDVLAVLVSAVDAFGNLAEAGGPVLLQDSVGGLDVDRGTGSQECNDLDGGVAACRAVLWTAADRVVITATALDEDISGTSNPVDVVPGTASSLVVEAEAGPVVAGEELQVSVQLLDALLNPVDIDPDGADSVEFQSDHGTLDCGYLYQDPDHTAWFSCTPTVADPADTLVVDIPSRRVAGALDGTFEVINGELSLVVVDIGAVGTLLAGDPLDSTLEGFDAFDNPYVVQSDPVVELSDSTGTLSPDSITLGPDGTASKALVVTLVATGDQVEVSRSGTLLGLSDAFDVLPNLAAVVQVSPSATWAWVGEALDLELLVTDAWGNTVEDYAGAATLSSGGGLGPDVDVSDWTLGRATAAYTWTLPGLEDVLTASDGTATGSVSVDALQDDCADPPVADVAVGGESPAVLCLSAGSTPTTTVSTAGSTAGGAAIEATHYSLGEGDWARTTSSGIPTAWTAVGGYTVEVVLADAEACGASASARVYVAEDDGQPAGPVSVELTSTSLTAGHGGTNVNVSATDCIGDPASGGLLFARVDTGELTAGAASTGSGMGVTLDGLGEQTLTWSVEGSLAGGTGTFRVGTLAGTALGSASIDLDGDNLRPTVVAVAPFGTTSEFFGSVAVEFSEEMADTSADATFFDLTAPGELAVNLDSVTLSADARTITLALTDTEDASDGTWTLEVGSDVRDAGASLRLDGAFGGSGSPSSSFVMTFGGVADEGRDVLSCTPIESVFRPDGDDASGEEADSVDVAVLASDVPTWWVVEVSDADGNLVRLRRLAAAGASETLSWDGRNSSGFVVANGTYDLSFTAQDDHWNEGTACTASVTVDNTIGSDP